MLILLYNKPIVGADVLYARIGVCIHTYAFSEGCHTPKKTEDSLPQPTARYISLVEATSRYITCISYHPKPVENQCDPVL